MKSTLVSLLFWVALSVVGVAIWTYSSTFGRMDQGGAVAAEQAAAAKTDAADPEAKLKELGIVLPAPGAPIANYVNAVQTGN
ncbi:MAG TPA: hypothetical protein VMN81_02145, partial [Vicinamibacterales bacterium]|nr:hypothetical protein [Vicinamibacterales bacterium]